MVNTERIDLCVSEGGKVDSIVTARMLVAALRSSQVHALTE